MIGNDLVDLNLADRNAWKRRRFLNKVFAPAEQQLLSESFDPGTLQWILWSMKESAYKLHYRKNRVRALNPIRFVCALDSDYQGRAEIDNEVYHIDISLNKNLIHSIAKYCKSVHNIFYKTISSENVDFVRMETISSLVQSFSKQNDYEYQGVNFQKNSHGIPFLREASGKMIADCSISHHGRFGAYAFVPCE